MGGWKREEGRGKRPPGFPREDDRERPSGSSAWRPQAPARRQAPHCRTTPQAADPASSLRRKASGFDFFQSIFTLWSPPNPYSLGATHCHLIIPVSQVARAAGPVVGRFCTFCEQPSLTKPG
ncbi:hypothetical protein BO70DRAFT_136729 [Aspergillus heteromorphus CBS 117.55]|uniref:Uncharacterized protein n=1 Tax=Aspergillus heteromorphus CBS 117.55 TaxID=1448321 RepID=A0A317X112_9EURO|nr:uncharacterized protein BO70DRAFT_136729 [Aspergillus heteromorphus CBS 117.55]PWY90210.1 hypothetical protein BO70DRAFT_136729 [Aspergillus heteromorphus CBS 117.55]